MRHKTTALTILLFGSITVLVGSSLPSVSPSEPVRPESATVQKNTEEKSKERKGQQQMSGADAERETGRRALRRGEAGEARGPLGNALQLYKGGGKWGGASTHCPLGGHLQQQERP